MEQKIFNYLQKNLTPERYYHSLCVYELAVKLAKFYKVDVYTVSISALLHDCAKWMNTKQSKNYITKNNIKIKNYDFVIKYLPQILHSYIGADIAQKKFNIKSKNIINAIKHHTVGRVNMTIYEKIIFIADSLSADRKHKLPVAKKDIFDNLDNVFKIVLQNKIKYVINQFKILHPDIINIWNFYNK